MPRGQRPSRRILSVEFETEVQPSGPQFSLPKEIARFLGVDSNDQLYRARWDEEIDRDLSPGGAGIELLNGVRRQVSDGHSRPLSEGRPRR
jgi:hypothetical protein